MSIALSTARINVERLTRDVDRMAAAVKAYMIDQTISNNYQLVSARLHMPLAWATISALTPGTATYTTTASEYNVIGLFRLTSNLEHVEKVSPSILEARRQNAASERGQPLLVCFTEAAPGTVGTTTTTFTLWPAPNVADTLEGFLSTTPGVVSADADKIQLGEYAQRATEYLAAEELLTTYTPDTAARVQINLAAAKLYAMKAAEFIQWEQVRIRRQRSGRMANKSRRGWWW